MDQLGSAYTQLANEVEQPPRQQQSANRRANRVIRQLEQLRLLKARWKGLLPQTEALLSLASPQHGEKLTMESMGHGVPRRYTMVGDQMRGLYSMLQELNTKLEGELDAQDKFAADVERLVHMVSGAEKRLAKVTGVWIPSAPTLLSSGAHVVAQTSIGECTFALALIFKVTKHSLSLIKFLFFNWRNLVRGYFLGLIMINLYATRQDYAAIVHVGFEPTSMEMDGHQKTALWTALPSLNNRPIVEVDYSCFFLSLV